MAGGVMGNVHQNYSKFPAGKRSVYPDFGGKLRKTEFVVAQRFEIISNSLTVSLAGSIHRFETYAR